MALDFPPTAGAPTDGSYKYVAQTTLGQVEYTWNGTYWHAVTLSSIDDLDDVELTNAQVQDILVYNGNQWLNEPDLNGGVY